MVRIEISGEHEDALDALRADAGLTSVTDLVRHLALVHGDGRDAVVKALRVAAKTAGPWESTDGAFERWPINGSHIAALAERTKLKSGEWRWSARPHFSGHAETPEEGKAKADLRLIQDGWTLLPQPADPGDAA